MSPLLQFFVFYHTSLEGLIFPRGYGFFLLKNMLG